MIQLSTSSTRKTLKRRSAYSLGCPRSFVPQLAIGPAVGAVVPQELAVDPLTRQAEG